MKITSVTIFEPASTENIELSFRDPRRLNPYNVKTIVGLDADEIVPLYYGTSSISGQKFHEFMLPERELVMRIELNPNYASNQTHSMLRDNVYRLISKSRTGLLNVFFSDGEDIKAKLDAHIVKVEASHFSATPEVQITLKPLHPFLKSPNRTVIDISSLDPAYFVIDDLESTARHGALFEFLITGPVSSFRIDGGEGSDWFFTINPATDFIPDDRLFIGSEHNLKEVYMLRGSTRTNLGDRILAGSFWPIIFPGSNEFSCLNPAFVQLVEVGYIETYWGV